MIQVELITKMPSIHTLIIIFKLGKMRHAQITRSTNKPPQLQILFHFPRCFTNMNPNATGISTDMEEVRVSIEKVFYIIYTPCGYNFIIFFFV